ncbi:nucleoside diphosphate kinase (macronuclear) [Tetrahymena thermophila SB210]|uniref:Nucleoside diphosphate kinase n=1 Tax=Tetrahymena thermophila (strain SB210) TaxID=312017 RepID=I7MKD9_TETTS|nr:nucleoside diphosphate kinase [Tetrahymena thermophila SB210]EAR98243.1 nucleoside diphosphate kinase [Tetrahymena thermophila SB210]|eukprot:XP_001018488.1 nucleoside diphosphate kinase [Tetrahymena thermophila SB210]
MADERTFIMIKPDGVQRGLVGNIISRFESRGYQLIAMKFQLATKQILEKHYEEHISKPFFPSLLKFMLSGPVVPMVWQGKDVVKQGRAMLGQTNPLTSAPGTIRGDFGIVMQKNLVHGSDSVESAKREIAIWFQDSELTHWKPAQNAWIYE